MLLSWPPVTQHTFLFALILVTEFGARATEDYRRDTIQTLSASHLGCQVRPNFSFKPTLLKHLLPQDRPSNLDHHEEPTIEKQSLLVFPFLLTVASIPSVATGVEIHEQP